MSCTLNVLFKVLLHVLLQVLLQVLSEVLYRSNPFLRKEGSIKTHLTKSGTNSKKKHRLSGKRRSESDQMQPQRPQRHFHYLADFGVQKLKKIQDSLSKKVSDFLEEIPWRNYLAVNPKSVQLNPRL